MPGIPNRGTGPLTKATLDGVDNSGLFVPSEAALQVAGSICLVARARYGNTGLIQGLLNKYLATGNQRAYRWSISGGGSMVLHWSSNGTAVSSANSNALPFAVDQAPWLAVSANHSNGEMKFWVGGVGPAPTWVQHGPTLSTSFAGNFASTAELALGSGYTVGAGWSRDVLAGDLMYAAVYDGIGANTAPGQGTKVFEINTFGPGNTFVAGTGQVVTRAGGVTFSEPDPTRLDAVNDGLVRVEGPAVWFPGSNNNALSATSSATDRVSFKNNWQVTLRVRPSASDGTEQQIFGMYQGFVIAVAAAANQWRVYAGGTVAALSVPFTPGVRAWWRFTRPVGNGPVIVETSPDSDSVPTSWTTVGTVSTGSGVTIDSVGNWTIGGPSGLSALCSVGYAEAVDGAGETRFRFNALTDITDQSATSIIPEIGPPVTVQRSTTGAATTLIPKGSVVYINPDDLSLTNALTVPNSSALSVAADEDAVLMFVGDLGNVTAHFTIIAGMGASPDTSLMNLYNGNAVRSVRSAVRSAGQAQVTASTSHPGAAVTGPFALVSVLNRATDTIRTLVYGPSGVLLGSASSSTSTIGAVANTTEILYMLRRVPGWVSSAAWSHGVGIAPSDATLAVLVRQLLTKAKRQASYDIGSLPPPGPPVYGDRWKAANGHTVFFNGVQWDAVSPTTGNLAVLIANAQLLIGAGYE